MLHTFEQTSEGAGFRMELTPQQLEAVSYDGPSQVIYGPAGTGKTVVLLARARRLAAETGATVRVFTYNRTLAKYARDQLSQNGASAVDAVHFHRWARRLLVRLGTPVVVIEGTERLRVIADILARYRLETGTTSRLLKRDTEWWQDEFDWLKGCAITDLPTYLGRERVGRGSGLQEGPRRTVWEVFEHYRRALDTSGRIFFQDFALVLLNRLSPMPDHLKVDHVLIDEAQDMHFAQLRLLTQLARRSITVAADRHQKIYKSTFDWKDVGIDVTGGKGVKRLQKTFRSTRQIIALASGLRKHDPLVRPNDPDYVSLDLPETEGPVPTMCHATDSADEAGKALQIVREFLRQYPGKTVALLARTSVHLDRFGEALRRDGISFEYIRGEEGNVATPGVKLATCHAAKGLEFYGVVLTGLTDGVLPLDPELHCDATDPKDVTEFLSVERRLLYVSMTRARHILHLVHSIPPSRFLNELDPQLYRETS